MGAFGCRSRPRPRGWAIRLGKKLVRIISSDEVKAIETAEIIAAASGISVEIAHDTHENDRSATGFLLPPQFEDAANLFFAHPEESFKGWERAVDAQKRIVSAVTRILADHDPSQPIAFVGHGGVGTLLKCHLTGSPIARDRDQPGGGEISSASPLRIGLSHATGRPSKNGKGSRHERS